MRPDGGGGRYRNDEAGSVSPYNNRPGGITQQEAYNRDFSVATCASSWMTHLSAAQLTELQQPITDKPKGKGMFTEIKNDVTKFVSEYRYIFYFLALALLVDQFLFKGIFRERLTSMMDKMVSKIEAKVAGE